ncbi:hypothetical protein LTR36_005915 [Oleoguttula mirabilis]|uniref:6,7-dimethyl-8-ribityllumazine synthase n=1 Tax=Oleoguttula mirabilis TaxID=1507867 RepID=A0AAV9JDD2_9PEZI|nr:hypothetical protein LTR36_005915 [Oleoguttula mirabilis]
MSTSAARKPILLLRLKPNDTAATALNLTAAAANMAAMVATSIAQANAAGFDIEPIEVDPDDPQGTLVRLSGKLRSQHWEGVLIGFAFRGAKEHTPIFEAAVNVVASEVVARGTTRLLFGNAPDNVMAVLERNFGVAE